MAENFVVFITGVNRGIGNSLATAYLLQPNCTVIGSVRDDATPEVTELKSVPKGDGSLLYLVEIESSNPASAINAVSQIQAAGTNHIDILIANAAVSPPIEPIETVSLETMADTYSVNTLGPLAVYQACYAMLKNSKREPKFVTVTSAAGSIAGMASGSGTFVAPAYCVSKAGLNWITLAAHCSNEWLVAVAINPGLVATEMGNKTAEYLGLEKAPWTARESAEKIIGLIEKATRENYSGKFMDAIKSTEFPW